jgi:GT2 family glycosyltransferase
MGERPRIGLVTVTYNSGSVLQPFLDCVRAQQLRDYRLIVVDNASSDATMNILRAHTDDQLQLIANPDNRGVAEGNNQGIVACREAGIEWVLLINNDTEFTPDLLESLLSSARELNARVLVPRITYFSDPSSDWFAGGHFSWLRGFQSRHTKSDGSRIPRRIHYSPTCCMLVRMEVFDEVGMMDPAYFVYWDDTDFCWRLGRHGVPILYDPRVTMAHKVHSLTGGQMSAFSTRYDSRNQIYFLRKHFGPGVVQANLAWIRMKNRLRLLLGRDDEATAGLRRKAIAEGLRVPLDHAAGTRHGP